jgi:hypothetical protein
MTYEDACPFEDEDEVDELAGCRLLGLLLIKPEPCNG